MTPDQQPGNVRSLAAYADEKRVGEGVRRLPQISVTQQMRDVTEAAIRAIITQNAVSPSIFVAGGQVARVATEVDGKGRKFTLIRQYGVGGLRGDLARIATWVRPGKDNDTDVPPPTEVVVDLVANADKFGLPVLRQIVHSPIFAADGTLHAEPGYSPATQCWYEPRDGMKIPPVPSSPTDAQVRQAAWKLMGDYLGNFPFETPADRALALALMLLPFMRQLIDGHTPLHLVEASTPGTGKTLLVQAIFQVCYGGDISSMTECKDDAEWSKQITAKLMTGQPIFFIDNVSRTLASAKLASVITSRTWEDRILGASQMLIAPIEHVFVATGNNISASDEVVRRLVRCRLNAHVEKPWQRTGFRHPELLKWGAQHRSELVAAALTLIQTWLDRDRPMYTGRTLGMFEPWAGSVGGVLQIANQQTAFLGNLDKLYAETVRYADNDRAFITGWWEKFGGQVVMARDLVPVAAEHLELGRKTAVEQFIPPSAKSVGWYLVKIHGRVYGDLEVVRTAREGRGDTYQLAKVQREEGSKT